MKRSSERRVRRWVIEELTRCMDLRSSESASLVPVPAPKPRPQPITAPVRHCPPYWPG
jgi:hypothetical protein